MEALLSWLIGFAYVCAVGLLFGCALYAVAGVLYAIRKWREL